MSGLAGATVGALPGGAVASPRVPADRSEPAPLFIAGPVERSKERRERVMRAILLVNTLALLAPLAAILVYVAAKAWPALSWSFIVHNPMHYMTAGGIWAPLVGTATVVALSLAIAAPVGVLAGVYLNEWAGDTAWTRIVNLAVVTLAGVPSIVHALFGVAVFVALAQFGRSVIAASCTLAIMTLPVIIASTKQALAAVPFAFREACWNVGATRWQTIRTIVVPNAVSGILTGVILQVSRAAGETAPILFTGAVFYAAVPESGIGAYLPYGLRDPFMALSYHLFTITTQVTGIAESWPYATAIVLVALVLSMNAAAIVIRARLRARRKW